MPQVADLLHTDTRLPIRLLAGPVDGPPLLLVTAVESLDELGGAPRGALVVVTGRAAGRAPGYRMDVAIRQAAERALAGVVLIGREDLPVTAVHLAERAGIAVLSALADHDVAEVVLHIDRIIRGGAADVLARAEAALAAIRDAEPGGSVETLLGRAGEALDRPVTLDPEEGEPIWINGRRTGAVTGPADHAVRLVLPALAAAVARLRTAALEREIAPGQTRSDILTELIVAERAEAGRLTERARALGFPIDGMHTVIWMAPAGPADLAERRRLFDTLALRVHALDGGWNLGRITDDVALVCSAQRIVPVPQVRQVLEDLIAAVVLEHPGTTVRCGIGTGQRGLDGLRQSVLEARAAAGQPGHGIHVFDTTGVRRILAEVSASPLSRRVVNELLAPLDNDGTRDSIATLCAYLDARGSLKTAAARLHLHPNTVTYRLRQITELLDVDLTDPDTAFALHLACRVRLQG